MSLAGTFLGAALRNFNVSISWGLGGPSQLTATLVDDPANGAYFDPPDVGTPVYLGYGQLVFNGLLQKQERRRGADGETYEVVVVDPRELLDGTQVITGGYYATVGGVPNLLNAFGHWESQGYGSSGANDAGMPWWRVRDAVLALVNRASATQHGGPIRFRGYAYGLDLRHMPPTPAHYRVGSGAGATLLELISQVCEDHGRDFFVELRGRSVVVRTVSRASQPSLGSIAHLAGVHEGTSLSRVQVGLELRNEQTSSFLVGGPVCELSLTSSLRQFWGYSATGEPVVGAPHVVRFLDKDGNLLRAVNTEIAPLNAAPVADILGRLDYPCTALEMRLALANYDSWATFLENQRPLVAKLVGVVAPFRDVGLQAAAGPAMRVPLINDGVQAAFLQAANAVNGAAHVRSQRLYELVRGYAEEYLGKVYLAALPAVQAYVDGESGQTKFSYEITDGGYLPEGSAPLGLSALNEDVFANPDGRFRAFAVYRDLAGADFSKISPDGSVIEGGSLYVPVEADGRLIFVGGAPAAVITLSAPLTDEAAGVVGDLSIAAALFQKQPEQAQPVFKQAPVPVRVAPDVRAPSAVAVPLKSNLLTYGPWSAVGAPGKVRFQQDPSLTPWEYGSHELMDRAARASVLSSITNQQVSEAGAIELAGPPSVSVGESLMAGGPVVTAIDVSVGEQGVTTSYRFATYTPRFGVTPRSSLERERRLSLAAVEARRNLRSAARDRASLAGSIADAGRARKGWMANLPKNQKRETPSDCLVSYSEVDQEGRVHTQVGATTLEEAVVLSNADDDALYARTAVCSLSALFRPFATDPGYAGGVMPALSAPTVASAPNSVTLDDWGGANGSDVWAWGATYEGLNARGRGGDGSDARVLGLRVPAVLVGWGYDVFGSPVPESGGLWPGDVRLDQSSWKAGPSDVLWDPHRGCWTSHTTRKGLLLDEIAPGGSGRMEVAPLDGDPYELFVWNWSETSSVPSGVVGVSQYFADDNRNYVTAVDCAG